MRYIALLVTGCSLVWIVAISALLLMYRLVYLRQKVRSFAEGSLKQYGQVGSGFVDDMDWFWANGWPNDPIAHLVKRQFAYTLWGRLAEKQRRQTVPQATFEQVTWDDIRAVIRARKACRALTNAVWKPIVGDKKMATQEYAKMYGWSEANLRSVAHELTELIEKLEGMMS